MGDYSSITKLDLSNKGLTELPDLSKYTNLKELNCSDNQLTSLDNLPLTLTTLYCNSNQIFISIEFVYYLSSRILSFFFSFIFVKAYCPHGPQWSSLDKSIL